MKRLLPIGDGIGMRFAASRYPSPVMGFITQELFAELAVLNASRAAFPPQVIHEI